MKRLTREERARIIQVLWEGQFIRAVTRFDGPSKNTMAKLLRDAGDECCKTCTAAT